MNTFTNLADMAASSDAVVEATVMNVEPGRVVGPEDDPVQLTQVTLQVDRVLYGLSLADVILLEEGFGIRPLGSEEGTSGIFFLHLKDEDTKYPYYRLTNSQGRFVEASGKIEGSNDEMEWIGELEEMTPSQFEQAVAEAVTAAENRSGPPMEG